MENNNGIISGNVFIIPNSAANISGTKGNFICEKGKSFFIEHTIKNIHEVLTVPKDEIYIEIWAFSPDNNKSNWTCHSEMPGQENFPNYLPAKLFKGKKEGDTIEFLSKWGTIRLKLTQQGYRYQQFGNFEDVLEYVTWLSKREE